MSDSVESMVVLPADGVVAVGGPGDAVVRVKGQASGLLAALSSCGKRDALWTSSGSIDGDGCWGGSAGQDSYALRPFTDFLRDGSVEWTGE